eukprot:Nitzschia sp. Nitz4//scaffold43_size134323//92493//93224//NITZ4_003312-RA/size134323-snap-gene-0.87-mRNA-1//-1//CDS//3329551987//2503//frame0
MPCTNQPLHLIVDLNNRGVAHLEKGNLDEAVSMFCNALSMARSRLSAEANHGDCYDSEDSVQMEDSESLRTEEHLHPCGLEGRSAYEWKDYGRLYCMFNLALAHHLWSLNVALSETRSTLQAAGRLYELTYSLLMQQTQDETGGIMSMAIINNLAQIHHACGDEHKAISCRNHLVSLFMYFQQFSDVDVSSFDSISIMSTLCRQLLRDPATSPAA